MGDEQPTREVVLCNESPACGSLGPDHHGWSCPLSDPHGDVLRAMMDPHPNPILEESRKAFLFGFLSVRSDDG